MVIKNVVITGANGAGKTNILEAISMLTVGKGMRGTALHEHLRIRENSFGGSAAEANFWAVRANLQTANGECQLTAVYDAINAPKRVLKLEDDALPRQADILQYLSILWFLPTQSHLFQSGMSDKRKYFDRIVFSFDSSHATRINAYEHYMRERGRLLKIGNYDAQWVTAIEAKIAQYALEIVGVRLHILQLLNQSIQMLDDIFPKAILRFEGEVEQMMQSHEQPEIMLQQSLKAARNIDARSGRCSLGAHKSQFHAIFSSNNRPAELCSTGEQKALLLSILMAQIKALQFNRPLSNTPIILLLDEMVAHLDINRRNALFSLIKSSNIQVFATGTDDAIFINLENTIHVRL